MRLESDDALRKALFDLYVALFSARKHCPADFPDRRLTTIMTAFMGVENVGWRVVGITMEALDLLATVGFDKNKLPRRLCRGHLVDRIRTTRELFNGETPLELDPFFNKFLSNDVTVIMLNEQNRAKEFPAYLPIHNPDAELFPNGSLMSWKHRAQERECLRRLHASLAAGGADILRIEQRLHTLIRSRVEAFDLATPRDMPHLQGLRATKKEPAWFPVGGMYGGFRYYFDSTRTHPRLVVESWSRVVGGSGERHHLTPTSTKLVGNGFD